MKKKYYLLTVLFLASAVVWAGVHSILSTNISRQDVSASKKKAAKMNEVNIRWDFTIWSQQTVENLKNDDKWSDIEKANSAAPTELSKDNIFWQVTAGEETLTANGTEIKELAGLRFTNNKDRALAIAVNYPQTTSDTYRGGSYLWLGSSSINYFIIPNVKAGSIIKMGVESHKSTDARGVDLSIGGTTLLDKDGNNVPRPTTYQELQWYVPQSVQLTNEETGDEYRSSGPFDVLVKNTNGCHLYFIEAVVMTPQEQETVDLTSLIVNAGFDEELTFNAEGSIKTIVDSTTSLSDRSTAFIAADGTVYAKPKATSSQNRSDGRKMEAFNGFRGETTGWTLDANIEYPKCEWVYFGTIPYGLAPTAIPIGDDGTTCLEAPTKPDALSGDDNIGYAYMKAGWGNRASYSQTLTIPAGAYELSYWTINQNPNATSGVGIANVTIGEDIYTDKLSILNTEWTQHTISFTANKDVETVATITIGFEAGNTSSAANPYLCLDGLQLKKVGDVELAPEPSTSLESGTYYLYNIMTKQYLAGGSSWCTKAIVNATGLDCDVTLADGKYSIDTKVSNGGDSHYLWGDLSAGIWTDNSIGQWYLEDLGDGTYRIFNDNDYYLTSTADGMVKLSESKTEGAVWQFVTKEQRIEGLKQATIDQAIDATFLIDAANFNRNDTRVSAWQAADGLNAILNGGINENYCGEFYHSTGKLQQQLANAPAGFYELKAQGFYRLDGSDNANLPYFFANDEQRQFPVIAGSENSMVDAATSFSSGLYSIECIQVNVESDGQLTIGVANPVNAEVWGTFDNFQLLYYGNSGDFSVLKPIAVDMTDSLANPGFEENEVGWIKEAEIGGNVRPGGLDHNKCYEAWNNESFDIYQNVDNLPVGIYEISVQGFYRYLASYDAYDSYRNGNVITPVFLYANNKMTPLKNIFSEPISNDDFYQDDDIGGYFYEGNNTGYYFPNSMLTAATAFDAGMYQNKTFAAIFNEGDALRIGVKGSTIQGGNSWAIWDNFKLTYWGMVPSKVQAALANSISDAEQALATQLFSERGKESITNALRAAQSALESTSTAEMFSAMNNLNNATSKALTSETLEKEEFTFSTSDYDVEVDTIKGQKVTLVFSQGDASSNRPTNYDGYIRVYAYNTLDVLAEENILDIQFSTYSSSYSVKGSASTGSLANNHWTGLDEKVTLTNSNSSQWRINKVTVILDNPSEEVLKERLLAQIAVSDSLMGKIVYQNTPGLLQLKELFQTATTTKLDSTIEKSTLANLVKNLKKNTETVVALDKEYQQIASLIANVKATAESNKYADSIILSEATTYMEEVTTGLNGGIYTSDHLPAIRTRLNEYNGQLGIIYLSLHINEAGTLGDSILARVENFTDVIGLRVSGNLNSTDMTTIKNRVTKARYFDFAETSLTYIDSEQFRDRTNLRSVILPNNLLYINSYAFYGCTSLQQIDFPSSLQSIGNYAFYNSGLTSIVVPEGVTSIGNYAFASDGNYSYVYDANGNYVYDEYGNIMRVYKCKLESATLPSTLTSLGSYAFQYQRYLKEVSMGDGLTSISNNTFYYCESLTNLTLPSTLRTIGSSAFYNCTSLKRVEIPDNVTTIDSDAFSYCSNLEEVVLPSKLQNIYHPFRSCSKLVRMTCKAIVPPYANGYEIMGGKESQCTLTVPSLSAAVYKQTSYWDQFKIVGTEILPENIVISDTYKLSWPDSVSLDYKPNITLTMMDRGSNYDSSTRYRYGALTVTGTSTLSVNQFYMFYNFYSQYQNSSRTYNFTSLINQGSIRADEVILRLRMYANKWNFICLPFDVKVSDIWNYDKMPYVIRKYDGQKRANGEMASTWINMTADSTLHAGQGYIWQAAPYTTQSGSSYYEMDFLVEAQQSVNKNNIFTSSNVEVPLNEYLSEFPQNRSWNLIGNPYPCYFDTRAMDITAPITVWSMNNNSYQAYSPVDDSYILTPGEAFFIQRPVDQESVLFMKEGRQANRSVRNVSYFASARMNSKALVRQSDLSAKRAVFNLILTNGDQSDRTRFVINQHAQLDYELNCDANKFLSEDARMQLYTLENGLRYAINERPLYSGEIALGATFAESGTYTIYLDTTSDNEVYLIDHLAGTETLLTNEGYTFSTEAGIFENRFSIRMGSGEATGIVTLDKSSVASDNYYNLNGTRVIQPKKGLYINNGKKVVVK